MPRLLPLFLLPCLCVPSAAQGSVPAPLAAVGAPGERRPALPDVVVFVLDDVGAADVEVVDTPAIDALSARGTRFTRGYGQPMCAPARHSLLASVWQGVGGGFTCEDPGPTSETLPHGTSSLPKVMEAAGYRTALFGRWGLGTTPRARPSTDDWMFTPGLWGFETWQAGVPDGVSACLPFGLIGGYQSWLRVDDASIVVESEYQTIALREAFLAWWMATPAPRFAVVALQAAHQGGLLDQWHIPPPGAMPPGYVPPADPGPRKRFEAMVQSADYAVGRMLEAVSLDDTLIVLLSDNGTPKEVPPPGIPKGKVKFTTFEGGVRVPFVIAGLGFPQGQECARPVSIVDVAPTLADLVGLPAPGRDFDGQSLLGALAGEPPARPWAFVQREKSADYAVIEERWKLRELQGDQVLYDLWLDPAESAPLDPDAQDLAEVAARLRAALARARS